MLSGGKVALMRSRRAFPLFFFFVDAAFKAASASLGFAEKFCGNCVKHHRSTNHSPASVNRW